MERAETLQNIATARQYCEMMDTLAERITSLKEKIQKKESPIQRPKNIAALCGRYFCVLPSHGGTVISRGPKATGGVRSAYKRCSNDNCEDRL